MLRKAIAVVCIISLIVSCLSGCDKGGNVHSSELTIMYKVTENGGYNTSIMDAIEENTGIDANYIKAPNTSYTEKLNSVLASGKLPEIVYLDHVNMEKWAKEGALLPIDDLIKKYAPNVNRVLSEEDKKNVVASHDGKLYGTPYILRLAVDKTMGVRRDWMEKLSLSDPETIEQFEYVLTKFKENEHILNPGGKVIPYVGSLSVIYMMFGIQMIIDNNDWTVDDNGNYILIYDHPNFIKCIETIRRFYQKGLIDREFMIKNSNSNEMYALFNSGVAGMGCVYATRLREISEILRQTDENALFDYMPPVKNINGERKITGRHIYGTLACITAAAKGREEECMKYIDYFYSEEGDRLLNYGIEGKHYDLIDGKPVIKDEFNHGWVKIRKEGIVPTNVAYNRNLDAYNQCMFYGKDKSELNEIELLTYKAYYENEKYIVPLIPALNLKTDCEETLVSLREKVTKTIIGVMSVEELKSEIRKAKSEGLDAAAYEAAETWNKIKK